MKLSREQERILIDLGATIGPKVRIETPAPTEPPKRHKYGAQRTEVDSIVFASKKEAARYVQLKLAERCGQISALETQPRFEIVVNGVRIGHYTADFRFVRNGVTVIEDVKSTATKTTAYRLRKRLVEAIYGIEITEV